MNNCYQKLIAGRVSDTADDQEEGNDAQDDDLRVPVVDRRLCNQTNDSTNLCVLQEEIGMTT